MALWTWILEAIALSLFVCICVAYYYADHLFVFSASHLPTMSRESYGVLKIPCGSGEVGVLPLNPTLSNPRYVLIFYHGNACTVHNMISLVTELCVRLRARGYLVEYRGYGCCKGWLPPNGLSTDAEKSFEFIREREDLGSSSSPPLPVIVVGESMGCAPACSLIAKHGSEISILVLANPWTSLPDMAASIFRCVKIPSWVFRVIMPSTYDNLGYMCRPQTPSTIILCSENDEAIPTGQHKKMYEKCVAKKKRLLSWPCGHNGILTNTMDGLVRCVAEFTDGIGVRPLVEDTDYTSYVTPLWLVDDQ